MKLTTYFLIFILSFCSALSQSNGKISYQGILTDETGEFMPDGQYSIEFSLYNTETGGQKLWNEIQNVDLIDGLFNVKLGEVNPITLTFDTQYWLGISVNSANEMSPRVELTSVPYAYRAQTVAEDAIGEFQIEDKSITLQKINTDDANNDQILRYNETDDVIEWSDDWTGGGSGGFSIPHKDSTNSDQNAFWIIHKGSGSVAKFDINNIGSGGHSLEATSNGQTATIFAKNTNETQSTASALYLLSDGVAPTARIVNNKAGYAALFEKSYEGNEVVRINSFGAAKHALNIYDSLGSNSTVKIYQADEVNLKPTLEVEGGHLKYSALARFEENANGSGILLELTDNENKWEAQQIKHFGTGTGLSIWTKNTTENIETNYKEASLQVVTETESASPLIYATNTKENYTGTGLFIEHTGVGIGIDVNMLNNNSNSPALNINNSTKNTAVSVNQNTINQNTISASGSPDSSHSVIYANSSTFGPAVRGQGTMYGAHFINTTNAGNGAALLLESTGLNNTAIKINKGSVDIDEGSVYINSGMLDIEGNQYGSDIQISGQIIAQGAIEANSMYLFGGFSASYGSTDGDFHVGGTLSKAQGAFKIDHPLDPTNKFLYHSFVESPDMKNIYDGVAQLDKNGEAVIELPEYFEALNKDFRYQLTCIGGWAQVYIAEKIKDNKFKIAGGTPGMEVSWMVTGIRHDPYADKHRIQVEVDKSSDERGTLSYPELKDEYTK